VSFKLPDPETLAALKAKNGGEVFLVEFGEVGGFIHRKPGQPECDEYYSKHWTGKTHEAAGNLIFQARLWPTVEKLDEMLDEAPAVVTECADAILGTAGASPMEIAEMSVLQDLSTLHGVGLAELESRTGRKVADIIGEHPRGSLRWCTIPGIGPSIVRRPSRMSFGTFEETRRDAARICQAARELIAESAVTDEKALPTAFSLYPAFSWHLAWSLAAFAGQHLEVRSGKL
jgi:hypothetical protein